MGPLAHAATTRLIGAPILSGLWMDAFNLLPTKKAGELSHGLPGLLVAAALGPRWLAGFTLHVALDAVSHDAGEGAVKNSGKAVWLP